MAHKSLYEKAAGDAILLLISSNNVNKVIKAIAKNRKDTSLCYFIILFKNC